MDNTGLQYIATFLKKNYTITALQLNLILFDGSIAEQVEAEIEANNDAGRAKAKVYSRFIY